MSIDRRIVSILYFNDINDIEKIDQFLGENNNYYEVMIDGQIRKLKIPGKNYDEVKESNFEKIMLIDNEIDDIIVKDSFKDKINDFEEKLLDSDIENKKIEKSIKETKKIKEIKGKDIKSKEIKGKDIKNKEIKNIDNDLNDFINLI